MRELGRGGMGVVYEVRDPASGAQLALKLIGGGADAEALVRFGREAELLARLLLVVDAGGEEGAPSPSAQSRCPSAETPRIPSSVGTLSSLPSTSPQSAEDGPRRRGMG